MQFFSDDTPLAFYYLKERFQGDNFTEEGLVKMLNRSVVPALLKLEKDLKNLLGERFQFLDYHYVLW